MESIRIKTNFGKLLGAIDKIPSNRTVGFEISDILKDYYADFVPKLSGELVDSAESTATGVAYNTEYAAYQYYGEVYGPNYRFYTKEGELVYWSPEEKFPTGVMMNHSNGYSFWDVVAWEVFGDEMRADILDVVETYIESLAPGVRKRYYGR